MKKLILFIFIIGFSMGLIVSSSINIINNRTIDKQNITKNKTEKTKIEMPKKIETPKNTISKENKKEEFITIVIQNGYTSEKVADILLDNGLIQHKQDFLTLLKSLNLSSKIRVGEKSIKKGISMLEIINIITS
ncbi:beta/alpha barrel domain-containing protein [Tepidibacter thalassicus]|uniref:YceG-like family protein n=1 Tax=Tepidibacter thalassicus DSM 15285 TaxID=1123350 RepID=A0A1M5P1Z0_9FIRM|nr:hypothetical protein [Tepidibacter thalassicus]SHG95429.1 hypothetical protein SAMN02744040_00327 [Tepidibacter thalassicus DSM 15285]